MTQQSPSEQDPWSRFGWLLWAAWMVFLIFPLMASLNADRPTALRVLGVGLTVIFGAVYAWGSARLDEASQRAGYAVLAALVTVAAASSLVTGVEAISFLPFVTAFAMFVLPSPWHWVAALVIMVGAFAALLVTDQLIGGGVLILILFAVTVGTGAGRMMSEQSHDYGAVREELTITGERERMARDVHDVLGHSLTVVSLKADLAARLIDRDPAKARAELLDIQRLTQQGLAEIRETVSGLRVAHLDSELLAASSALAAAGIEARLPEDGTDLQPSHRTVAGWVLREAVTNVVRHSGASHCEIRLGPACLSVRDDGCGFQTEKVVEASHGLRGLRERVAASGGTVEVASSADGTRVDVVWTQ